VADLKQQLVNKALHVLQDPRVAKALQNPKVIEGLMGALKLRTEVQKNLDAGIKLIAKSLNLATESEVRELKRAIKRLERELEGKDHRSHPKERAAE
jgi:transcriptional regulator NrdR family protein